MISTTGSPRLLARLDVLSRLLPLRADALRWVGGAYCILVSLALLILPTGSFSTQPVYTWLHGVLNLFCGLCLWSAGTTAPSRKSAILSLAATFPLLWLAYDLTSTTSISTVATYLCLALAVLVSIRTAGSRGNAEARPDLLGFVLGANAVGLGLELFTNPGVTGVALRYSIYPPLASSLYIVGGLAVVLAQLYPRAPRAAQWAAHLFGGAMLLALYVGVSLIDSAYWLLSFSLLLRAAATALLPWFSQWLTRFDGQSLRVRLALMLFTVTFVPVLLALTAVLTLVDSDLNEFLTVRRLVFDVTLLGGVAFGAIGWWLAGSFIEPITSVIGGVQRIANGERDISLDIAGPAELVGLGAAVEQMAEALDAREREREALLAQAKRLAAIVESAEDAIFSTDLDDHITAWNRGAEQLLGYRADEVLGQPLTLFYPPDHLDEAAQILERLRRGERVEQFETVRLRKDGTPVDVLVVASPVLDEQDQLSGISRIWHDISERKRAELALRQLNESLDQRVTERTQALQQVNAELRNLAAHMQLTREEERANIARELHDDLAQSLTVIKFDAAALARRLSVAPEMEPELRRQTLDGLRQITQSIDASVKAVRTLVANLRPQILDDMGLTAAVEWQLAQFRERTGIQTQFTTNLAVTPLEAEREVALFRILQESLTNVARHAQATQVDVRLQEELNALLLEVQDNGRGIDEGDTLKSDHFGILGMRERAILLGGEVAIEGTPGSGTRVVVRVPRGEISELPKGEGLK